MTLLRFGTLPGVSGRLPFLVVMAVSLVAATGCSSDSDGDLEAFCATARRFAADNPAAVFDRYDPADPASAVVLLRDAGDRLGAWAEEAPAQIDDDVEAISEAADLLADQFETPGAATSSTLQEQLAGVESSSERVVEFTRQNCEVDLDPTTTPPA